jgi:hypothetical protein
MNQVSAEEAPLVNLPDAVRQKRFNGKWSSNGDHGEKNSPTLAKTARMGHPTSQAQLHRRNFTGATLKAYFTKAKRSAAAVRRAA